MFSFEHFKSLIENYYLTFLNGLATTLILAIVGTAIGLVIGVLLAFVRNMEIKITDNAFIKGLKHFSKAIVACYVNFFRGTPMMVQAMIIFFMTNIWTSMQSTWIFNGYLLCGLIVITINTGAYMCEIVRSGFNGVDKGQLEGARSTGMSYFQTMVYVVAPQGLKNSIPTILNEYIVNIKDSSVLNVIGLTELYASVSIATNKNYFKVEGFVIIAIIYLVLTLLASFIVKLISRKLSGQKLIVNPFKHYIPTLKEID